MSPSLLSSIIVEVITVDEQNEIKGTHYIVSVGLWSLQTRSSNMTIHFGLFALGDFPPNGLTWSSSAEWGNLPWKNNI